MSPSSRRAIGILAALTLLAGLLSSVVTRVPRGSVMLSGGRAQAAGWRLAPGWRPHVVVPLESRQTLTSVSAPVGGGLQLTWDVEMHLAVRPGALGLDAGEVRSAGGLQAFLGAAAARSAARVLQEHPPADPLLPEMMALQEESIARDLSADGWVVSDVVLEFSETEDLRRLRRQVARALVQPRKRKVMIIGLDGADWQVMDPLLEAGRLPALAGLLRRGARADLRSNTPMLSPLLWTTVATGKAPEEHGIMDFLLVEPETGRKVPMSSRFRRVKALWNILTDLGLESQFIAWWATWPAEQVSGTLVTDRVSYSLFAGLDLQPGENTAGLTFPPGYMAEARERLVAPKDISYDEVRRFLSIDPARFQRGVALLHSPPESAPEDPVVAVARTVAAARSYHSLALDLLGRGQPDLFAIYYEGIDQMGHRFQHYMRPKMDQVSQEEHLLYRDAVTAYYVYQDELLGELVQAAEPATVFLILSDHGFRNGAGRPRGVAPYVSEKPGLWHRRYGIFALAGTGVRSGRLDTVSLYDIAPTVLHLLGLPRADDMPGRVLSEALQGDDLVTGRARLATYEGFGNRHRAPARTDASNAVEKEMIRELTALGYLGGTATPVSADAEGDEPRVTANYHLNLASILAGQGKYGEAEREARAALALAPIPDAFQALSQILEQQGDGAGAIRMARRALDVQRGAAADSGRVRLVGLLLDAGLVEDARRTANASFHDTAMQQTAQGLVAERDGRKQEAARLYREALELRPTLGAAMERLYRLVPPESLEQAVRRGLADNDQLAEFHNVLGVILKTRGDLSGAVSAYRRAVELNPDHVDYLANLGAAEMIRGNLDEALMILERALRKDPEHPDVHLNLGSVYGKAGKPRRSLEAFERAAELGAEGPGLEVGRILGHALLGHREMALQLVAQARERYPDDPALRELESDLR